MVVNELTLQYVTYPDVLMLFLPTIGVDTKYSEGASKRSLASVFSALDLTISRGL